MDCDHDWVPVTEPVCEHVPDRVIGQMCMNCHNVKGPPEPKERVMHAPPRGAIDSWAYPTTHGDTVTVWSSGRVKQRWHWRVQAANGEIVEHGEAYVNRGDAIDAALRHHPDVGEVLTG